MNNKLKSFFQNKIFDPSLVEEITSFLPNDRLDDYVWLLLTYFHPLIQLGIVGYSYEIRNIEELELDPPDYYLEYVPIEAVVVQLEIRDIYTFINWVVESHPNYSMMEAYQDELPVGKFTDHLISEIIAQSKFPFESTPQILVRNISILDEDMDTRQVYYTNDIFEIQDESNGILFISLLMYDYFLDYILVQETNITRENIPPEHLEHFF